MEGKYSVMNVNYRMEESAVCFKSKGR